MSIEEEAALMVKEGGGVIISDGSIFDDPCSTLPGAWIVTEGGGSTVTATTEEARSVFDLYSGAVVSGSNLARVLDLAAFTAPASPTTIYITQIMKIAGVLADQGAVLNYHPVFVSASSTYGVNISLWNDVIGVQDSVPVVNYTAWTPVYDTFFALNIIVNYAAKTCDVKVNNDTIITGAAIRAVSYTGRWSSSLINRETPVVPNHVYVDRMLVGTGTQEI